MIAVMIILAIVLGFVAFFVEVAVEIRDFLDGDKVIDLRKKKK